MRIDLDLRRLGIFVEVVRQGSFSKAAKAVFATQPTVSKAVRQLESEIGVPLLNRIGHRSELTAAGEIVFRRALNLLADSENLITELDDLRGLKRGTLRIGFPRLGSSAFYAAHYVSFRRRYPNIDVQISVHDSVRLEQLLRDGGIDLGLLVHPTSQEFDWREMRTDPLVVLMPLHHPLAGQKAIGLARLSEFPLVLFEEGFPLNKVILDACRDKGVTPKIAARSSQVDFIFELVVAGIGIALVPDSVVQKRMHRSVRRALLADAKCKWSVSLAWRRGAYLSGAAQAWLAHTRVR
jgi:DNA-binding transcriptional LysR family regulator